MAEVQILEHTKVGPHPLVAVRNLQPSQLQIQVLQVPQVPQGLLQVPPVLPVLEEIITPIMFKLCHIPFVIIWDLSRGEFLPLLLGEFYILIQLHRSTLIKYFTIGTNQIIYKEIYKK